MELKVINQDASQGMIQVSEEAFGHAYNEPLIHQVVTACMTNVRQGTKAQKTRAERRGGGKKPHPQKGTGRARAGSSRSPLWRKGGINFAAKPRDFDQKINKKMYQGALRSIIGELIRLERLVVVDDFTVTAPKTKEIITHLERLGVDDAFVVTHDLTADLVLASRNLYNVYVGDISDIDPVSLVRYGHLVVTASAMQQLQERLA